MGYAPVKAGSTLRVVEETRRDANSHKPELIVVFYASRPNFAADAFG